MFTPYYNTDQDISVFLSLTLNEMLAHFSGMSGFCSGSEWRRSTVLHLTTGVVGLKSQYLQVSRI